MFNNVIPAPLLTPSFTLEGSELKAWAIQARQFMRRSNAFNYKHARIKVPSKLRISNWCQLYVNYHDQLPLDYLEFEFLLCVNRSCFQFNDIVINHPSAKEHQDDVEASITEELKHKAIVGPFSNILFEVHFSCMITRPKPDDTSWVIVDLSYPHHNYLNYHIMDKVYDSIEFDLKYSSVDDIVDAITSRSLKFLFQS